MDDVDNLFHPSLEAALIKLDPEDGKQIMEYFRTQALLMKEKAPKALLSQAPPPPRTGPAPTAPANQPAATNPPPPSSRDRREPQIRRRRGERKAPPTSDSLSLGAEPRVDVSRLDLRVGRILSARRHPVADGLSVQEVDVGETAPRTVVSKLGGKTPLEELPGGRAVLLCNVRACKMRGVVSQARLLWCSAPDGCTELLTPPTGSAPGDRVTFLNYPGEPDRELQAGDRVWDLLQPHLQVDSRGVANYKGCGFEVKGKGLCRSPSLTDALIR
ncbi:aminoacyl tRNA synthase complex-interacting multifunctional protein 1 isoform X2 [Pseudoliparis swirei]|uniref:aminoacyl tRNA synthase complex-interacting multifunctional protein 1 isoform X2 n=1 Tax=Pseudoliparis swirei TaxID=2059687 RepID=UPI0024BDBEA1|nr:aminoacyl tRNA synthase complex-interacting multifunctional protein 1 isoform X2 [Pseudoliparis swirei]